MSELLKRPYELSIWSEEFCYIDANGGEHNQASLAGAGIRNQFIKEKKIAVIGTHNMNSPIRAYDPKLTQNVNGTNVLTFQMYYRYYDEEDEEFKLNPFVNLLTNERKIKLNYDGEWFDLVIKEIKEKSDDNIFTYTCKDQYITELSKTGYEVELDIELENNMGTVTELGAKVLEGSEWTVNVANSELIKQTIREPLMYWKVKEYWGLKVMESFTHDGKVWNVGDTLTVAQGGEVYISHSGYASKKGPFQVIFVPGKKSGSRYLNDKLLVDENGVVINGYHFTATGFSGDYNKMVPANVFGELLVSKPITKYVTEIDKYCNVYEKEEELQDGTKEKVEYYSYSENEYVSPVLTRDLISDKGWYGKETSTAEYEVEMRNIGTEENPSYVFEDVTHFTIPAGKMVYNTGLYDSRSFLKNLVKGEEYIFTIKPYAESSIPGSLTIKAEGKRVVTSGEGEDVLPEKITLAFAKITKNISEDLSGYTVFKATLGEDSLNLSEEDFLKYTFELQIQNNTAGNFEFKIVDSKFFKLILDGAGKWIVPDLQSEIESLIRTKHYFFTSDQVNQKPQKVFGTKNLVFSHVCYDSELASSGFNQKFSENCEKIRSIKGSKSNRFNLIQELCETFECWAKFIIDHDERGAITHRYESLNEKEIVAGSVYYDDVTGAPSDGTAIRRVAESTFIGASNHYQRLANKWVTFKKYVGAQNHAGFRYGVNLKSIQRTTKSDQITTRMIVQPNITEYAEGGFCSIQDALLNPTLENVMYNFEYYIRQKLLLREDLDNDLYGYNNGLGLYPKLKEWNNAVKPLISEQTLLSSTINTLTSRKTVYESIVAEAETEVITCEADIAAAGGVVDDQNNAKNGSDHIKSLFTKRGHAQNSIEKYQSLLDNVNSLLSGYKTKEATLIGDINEFSKKKNALSLEFYKKYSRFIQEGTWTSSEYFDPNDYYLDATYVLRTSAFPKVEYNISVLEISQTEDCMSYRFKIGDKTYIEDTEFFGWDDKGRPYKEEIIISALTYNLDDPSKNAIKVQNYKTQFEDLFQRIAATSQSLQYAEGRYERAAKAVDSDGFNSSLLQDSLKNNSLIIQNAANENVVWDETGITLTNGINLNQIVRLVSGGIVLSQDGGRTWTTGITAEGINANVITAGRLDTNKIRIFNAVAPTFEWDWNGITAYSTTDAGSIPYYHQFVRFNQLGLFGTSNAGGEVNGASINWNDINDIWNHADFSLTWKGLRINATPSTYGVAAGVPVISIGSGVYDDETGEETCYFRICSDGSIQSKTLGSAVDGVTSQLRELESTLNYTAEQLRITFEDKLSQSVTDVTGEINSLSSYFELTASNLKIGFEKDLKLVQGDLTSAKTEIDKTLESLQGIVKEQGESIVAADAHITSVQQKLESDLIYNAQQLRVEFQNQTTINYSDLSTQIANLSSYFELTAADLKIGFDARIATTNGAIDTLDDKLYGEDGSFAEISSQVTKLNSDLIYNAQQLRVEFQNQTTTNYTDLSSQISNLSSYFELTAKHLEMGFSEQLSNTRGELVADYTSRLEFSARELRAEFQNNIAGLSSDFSVTADALRSEFKDETLGLSSQIEQNAKSITLKVNSSDLTSLIQTEIDKIELSVTNGTGNSASIKLKYTDGNTVIESTAKTIQFTGLVTFSSLKDSTKALGITGNNIANGAITSDKLDETVSANIVAGATAANNASTAITAINNWSYYGAGDRTYIDGGTIYAGTVVASKIAGEYIYLFGDKDHDKITDSSLCGTLFFNPDGYGSSDTEAVELVSGASIRMSSRNEGNVYISTSSNPFLGRGTNKYGAQNSSIFGPGTYDNNQKLWQDSNWGPHMALVHGTGTASLSGDYVDLWAASDTVSIRVGEEFNLNGTLTSGIVMVGPVNPRGPLLLGSRFIPLGSITTLSGLTNRIGYDGEVVFVKA